MRSKNKTKEAEAIEARIRKSAKEEKKKMSAKSLESEFSKRIDMKDIMDGLHIKIGDIVHVNGNWLKCNEKYDLVTLEDRYNPAIPNWILGMVSGKYAYKVYSIKVEIFTGEFDGVC